VDGWQRGKQRGRERSSKLTSRSSVDASLVRFFSYQAMPIFVTSLMVPFLVVILRVIRSTDGLDTRLTAPEATKSVHLSLLFPHFPSRLVPDSSNLPLSCRFIFSQMFTSTIMLLIGGFTIAAALSKTRMDVIMATRILNLAGTKPSWCC